MVDQETAARAVAEKNRLDPPPDGREWSLGWTPDGQRAPELDRLISTEQSDDPREIFGLDGDGVRADLIDAALLALAELDSQYAADWVHSEGDAERAAARVMAGAPSGDAARALVNVALLAALGRLAGLGG